MNISHLNKKIVLIALLVIFVTSSSFAVSDAIHPNTVQVVSLYELSSAVVTVDDTVTVTRTFVNNESSALTSFYMQDVLPDEISIVSQSVKVNNVVVNYDFPTPVSSSEFTNYTEYQWVLDYPGVNGTYDLYIQPDDTVVVEYKIATSTVGTYDLPLHSFIAHNGTTGLFGFSDTVTVQFGVSLDIDDEKVLPQNFSLSQNYPNPFNPSTVIEFSVPYSSFVTLEVYNVLGQSVTTLVQNFYSVGNYWAEWSGQDKNGKSVPSGIYFYKLKTDDINITKKMVLLK